MRQPLASIFSLFLLVIAIRPALAADAVPVITSSGYVTSLVGQPFSYQITATGNPTSFGPYSFDSGDSLKYDQSSGLFSGVPPGSEFYDEPISATNASGTGTGNLVIDIEYDFALTPLYAFGGTRSPNPGVFTLGADGNFYIVNAHGNGYNFFILCFTPQGRVTQFLELDNFDDAFDAELITDQAGNFYGTISQGTVSGAPTKIVRISPEGQISVLYQLASTSDGIPHAPLCLARDGSLYGELDQGIGGTGGAVFRLSPDGTFTILHRLDGATEGNAPSALVEAADGNLYGTANTGGTGNGGTAFEVTPDGVFSVLQSFSSGSPSYDPSGPLSAGSDGNLYGTTGYDHNDYMAGDTPQTSFFPVVPGGPVTVLRTIDPATEEMRYPDSFVRGADGALYGCGFVGNYPSIISRELRRYALDGSSTSVHRFYDFQALLAEKPTVGADGNFYCQVGSGGPIGEFGAFVRIVSNMGQNSHPAFFEGEVALSNGEYYLQFAGGNPFGYYSFLADPNYLYHQDLGFEYVFDANDGKSGVYLYDFTSSTFFYTSPGFPFPYLYDFTLNTVLYYYPDPDDPGRYNTGGIRFFYDFATGQIITK